MKIKSVHRKVLCKCMLCGWTFDGWHLNPIVIDDIQVGHKFWLGYNVLLNAQKRNLILKDVAYRLVIDTYLHSVLSIM